MYVNLSIKQSSNEDLRIQRTKRLLREAITKLLKKNELKDISIKKISDEAMIYRTTFYAHYSDKYDLLEDYLIEAWKNEILLGGIINVNKQEFIKETYWKGMLDTVKYFKRYSKLYLQLSEFKPIISKNNLIYKTLKQFFNILLSILQPDDLKMLVSKERISEFYISGYINSILNWLESGAKESCESVTKDFITLTDNNLTFLINKEFQ
ncbi:MAG: TetR/AcrR family transcriptional regulator [Candidatus Lokiarchaeota archaeon]|nr:TetR/AcrR family transcriptional regulator [Candidatus Lokiarchaeota archaeon]